MVKNVYILSLAGWSDFVPVLWPSAKSYYELNRKSQKQYNWVLPTCEFLKDIEDIKNEIKKVPPDIFGVSLYVWNYEKSLELCKWVKETWPKCIVITGGPHQYFKHHSDWFKKHWFIDASLPSEVYGEIAITDLLDNLNNDNSVNWNLVEQLVYPNKDKTIILRSPKTTNRRDFKWNFSAFEMQREHLAEYVNAYYLIRADALHSKIETTRGCPYECTFCDWGGGLGTKVVLKDIDCVYKDLDVLLSFNVTSIYICDANFGINKNRDVEIVQYIADKKKSYTGNNTFPNIQYGGFAKTNKHFEYLKQIFTIEAKNNLSYVYKISQQSFQDSILENVKRTDLRANEHFELANYLRKEYYYDATVELILGLPGITVDLWYKEFDKPYEWGVIVRAYEWYLLPEAEAFDEKYRKKFSIGTAKKWFSKQEYSIPSEVVVEGATFTREDYVRMMQIYSAYLFFEQSGIYRNSIKSTGIKFSEFLKSFFDDCYPKLKHVRNESFVWHETHLREFVSESVNEKLISVPYEKEDGVPMLYSIYYTYEYYKNFEVLDPILQQWLISIGADPKLVVEESEMIVTSTRINTVKYKFLTKIDYTTYRTEKEVYDDIIRSNHYAYTNLLLATKTFSIHPKSLLCKK
jgi:hypothetical protein